MSDSWCIQTFMSPTHPHTLSLATNQTPDLLRQDPLPHVLQGHPFVYTGAVSDACAWRLQVSETACRNCYSSVLKSRSTQITMSIYIYIHKHHRYRHLQHRGIPHPCMTTISLIATIPGRDLFLPSSTTTQSTAPPNTGTLS